MIRLLVITLLLAVAGCGSRQQLRPDVGSSLPPRPVGVVTDATAERLMTPDTQARPARSDELLRRSEERRDDRFDLPPPG